MEHQLAKASPPHTGAPAREADPAPTRIEPEPGAQTPALAGLLGRIDDPADVRKLEIPQLVQLAAEIRERIIAVVSRNGGHLASSLGATELAIALHFAFDTPRDQIVWDVGHQAYAHKLLTGRRERFSSLRQYEGISGFLRRSESPYDVFGAGHAGTSISAALGLACARDLAGADYQVVAVIGDGAMTSGLAWEGMNNAGASGKNLILVLNDNRMSISPNVGALPRYFTDVISTETYNKLKADVWNLTGHFSKLGGGRIRSLLRELDRSIKALVVPGVLFEKMGFRYFGPVDGHNLSRLISIFKHIRKLPGPVLVHVYTTKGKGCPFAEQDASKYHGVGSFEKLTGATSPTQRVTYSEAMGSALVSLAMERPRLLALTAAMTDGTGLAPFAERFPARFFDVGIAEAHAVTFSAGLAAGGYRPVVVIYSTFLQRSYDNILHDVALQRLPVVFALDRAGLVGGDGPTHHGVFDLSYLRHIPNMVVMAPMDEAEVHAMLRFAVDYPEGPIALRYPRGAAPGPRPSFPETAPMQLGKAQTLRTGGDVALLAIGSMVCPALAAAEALEAHGISAQVVNARFVKPLDHELLESLAHARIKVLTLEENALEGGFGSAVLEYLQDAGLSVPVKRLGIPDRFIEHGPVPVLMHQIGLDPEGIVRNVLEWVKPKNRTEDGKP